VVDDRGRGGDEVDIVFAFQPVADDLEVQEPEKPAAEAEAEGGGGLHLEGEARVVQRELLDRVAQVLEIVGVDGEEAAEDDRHRGLEARQRRFGGLRSWVIVSPTRVSRTCLIDAVRKPISPGPSSAMSCHGGAEDAERST
jgi:hypothetical protein